MTNPLIKNGIYRHYKGQNYRLLDIVRHSETEEELVLYETLYENELSKLWVRPVKMFIEKINVNGQLVDRFHYIGDKKGNVRF